MAAFGRRHRAFASALCAAALLLAVAFVLSLDDLRRASRAQEQADAYRAELLGLADEQKLNGQLRMI